MNNALDIVTVGDDRPGIEARSVGGTGEGGGNESYVFYGEGGDGGWGGSGGDVVVNSSGNLSTNGARSPGIWAQSRGGGGGKGGWSAAISVGSAGDNTTKNVNLGVSVGGFGGDGRYGGAVSVTNSGAIAAQGVDSGGIFAQSIGGGGGTGGNGTLGTDNVLPMDLSGLEFAAVPFSHVGDLKNWQAVVGGSGGSSGNGGDVQVSNSGDIAIFGATRTILDGSTVVTETIGSYGIFAQSAGGTGNGGAVRITVRGDVLAPGDGSSGIFAQSRGDLGGGDIAVDIQSGIVLGGSGTGAGIRFSGGGNNVLTNHGTVTSILGAAGLAIAGSSGDERIDNFGTVTGSVDFGTGATGFRNRAGGAFLPGATVMLGEGNLLRNEGVLSPGGADAVEHTLLTGGLVQTAPGTFVVDLDLQGGRSDRIRPSGTSERSGELSLHLMDPGFLPPGIQRFSVVSGLDNVTNNGLAWTAPPSAGTPRDGTPRRC